LEFTVPGLPVSLAQCSSRFVALDPSWRWKEYEILKDVSLIIYSVADMDKAKRFFRELMGADPYADMPQYVGYRTNDGDMEIGLIPSRDTSDSKALAYWTVSDIAASVTALEAAGGTVVQPVTDVAQGLLVASVREPNGAVVGLRQPPKG
jgi:predicted enzyme related to lactoylglutathione lyase